MSVQCSHPMVKTNIADFTIQFEFFNFKRRLSIDKYIFDTEKVNQEGDFCKV